MYKDNLENAANDGESVAVNDNNKSRSRGRDSSSTRTILTYTNEEMQRRRFQKVLHLPGGGKYS